MKRIKEKKWETCLIKLAALALCRPNSWRFPDDGVGGLDAANGAAAGESVDKVTEHEEQEAASNMRLKVRACPRAHLVCPAHPIQNPHLR